MSKWNFVAMGQVGLTGWTREVAKPVARSIARRTGRPEAEILSLIGAAFLAVTLIDFIRNVDAVIAASPGTDLANTAAIGLWLQMTLSAGNAAIRNTYTSQLAGSTT